MNNVIKIKIHKSSQITWVDFEDAADMRDGKISTMPLSPDDCTLLAKELIAAALELISIK